jgi:hypothetical protein
VLHQVAGPTAAGLLVAAASPGIALLVTAAAAAGAALCVAALPAGVDAEGTEGMIKVRGSLALVDLDADPDLMAPQLRGLRVFAGYAGWGGGQLAAEISRGDWLVVPALPDDVLAPPDTDLWGRILRRQGMPLALLASEPWSCVECWTSGHHGTCSVTAQSERSTGGPVRHTVPA